MLCYVMLCYVMLCYVMSCYVMLCYVMLCYVMLCFYEIYMAPLQCIAFLHTSHATQGRYVLGCVFRKYIELPLLDSIF